MTMWLFIGPTLLAGIGQVTHNYSKLISGSEYVELGQRPKRARYSHGFAFILPIESQLILIENYSKLCDRMIYMTVCETEPVNPCYGILERFGTIHVPSEFSKLILQNQFPKITWKILHHSAPCPIPKFNERVGKNYIFYTIGNAIDPRKNMKGIIEAFIRCQFPNAMLLIKATCNRDVPWKIPGVQIINGLISDEEIEKIHEMSHCYINCSHSEGVGMGAVEAALRDKPVIIADYGGLKEYVRTPWVVPCVKGPIGFDDFLFTKDLNWGYPDRLELERCMKECYEQNVTRWDHSWTRDIVRKVPGNLLEAGGVRGGPVVL
jgi:glycosyltransferase involved in cell wall biosynthesis